MKRIFDHIDLRVPDLRGAARFYEALLPALGFTKKVAVPEWLQFETTDGGSFFGVTEFRDHVPNENRIAFRAEDRADLDRLAELVRGAGAVNIEGPMDYEPGYEAMFFEDPFGNRLEICVRRQAQKS